MVLITGTKVFTCRFSFFVAVSVCSCRFSCRHPTDKAFVFCWQPTHVDILLLVDKKYMMVSSVLEFTVATDWMAPTDKFNNIFWLMPLISVLGHACLDKLWLQPSSH